MSKRRVVVTGLGMITPLGLNVPDAWSAALAGKSGVKPITEFDVSECSVKISAHVDNFDPEPYLERKEIRNLDVFVQYSVAAAAQAIEDSGLTINEENAQRIGVVVGSGMGGLPSIQKNYLALLEGGPRRISPHFIPSGIINMAPGIITIKFGIKGPSYSVVSACASGTHNIGNAARIISYGDADVMLAGGAEMTTTLLGLGGFASARALSTRNDEPKKASRPWDRDRDGFVLGDGAGILVLEEYEHAKKRDAHIYAEFAGFGMSSDAFHSTLPDTTADGGIRNFRNVLNDAQINPEQVSYINAHGTSTIAGDVLEIQAIKEAFGDAAYKIPVSSTKSMTGHLLGATGAVEAIFSILAIRDQVVPPTINLDNPDDGCDIDLVPHHARDAKVDIVLSNSLGFGGTNCAIAFKRI